MKQRIKDQAAEMRKETSVNRMLNIRREKERLGGPTTENVQRS
jgi:hypothetical protein